MKVVEDHEPKKKREKFDWSEWGMSPAAIVAVAFLALGFNNTGTWPAGHQSVHEWFWPLSLGLVITAAIAVKLRSGPGRWLCNIAFAGCGMALWVHMQMWLVCVKSYPILELLTFGLVAVVIAIFARLYFAALVVLVFYSIWLGPVFLPPKSHFPVAQVVNGVKVTMLAPGDVRVTTLDDRPLKDEIDDRACRFQAHVSNLMRCEVWAFRRAYEVKGDDLAKSNTKMSATVFDQPSTATISYDVDLRFVPKDPAATIKIPIIRHATDVRSYHASPLNLTIEDRGWHQGDSPTEELSVSYDYDGDWEQGRPLVTYTDDQGSNLLGSLGGGRNGSRDTDSMDLMIGPSAKYIIVKAYTALEVKATTLQFHFDRVARVPSVSAVSYSW
jgi:hypothetical protein